MIKYAKIIDNEKGTVQIGVGCSVEYYIEIGMTQLDVEQSDIDFQWYLKEKCPMKTEEEKFIEAKEAKISENTSKAKQAIDNGYVLFKEAEFETNAQTVGDLTATTLLMQAGGIETYDWLSKDDKVVTMTVDDFAELGGIIASYKNSIWNIKYMYYKALIEAATTLEEIQNIVIDYTSNITIVDVEL